MPRVLVIDDDVDLGELLAQYLKAEGFDLEAVTSGEQGVARAVSGEHALVVLDVMLPGMQGFEVLRQIRAQSPIPVLMLTARGDDVDRILGLEMGADDDVPKPCNPRELAARMRAIRRRAHPQSAELASQFPEPMRRGELALDHGARVVRRRGEPVTLTTVEFQLLEVLLRAARRVVTREVWVRDVRGRDFSPFDRSIDVPVSNLRKKLGPHPDGTERIKGVRGFGYLYVAPDRLRHRGGSDAAPLP
jgi:two-component system, OmpR family, response regulator CpxR